MPRNDSILNTGLTGATVDKAERERFLQEKRLKRQEKKAKLTPAMDVVIEELNKEKQNTEKMLLSMVTTNTKEEDLKSLIVSLNLYNESMSRLKNRLKTIMRTR